MKKSIVFIIAVAVVGLSLPFGHATQAVGPNLVPNPSFETGSTLPTSWTRIGWSSTNRPVFTYPVAAQDGAKAARVTETTYRRGDIGWGTATFAVTPGAVYDFSEYSKSNVTSNALIVMTTTANRASTTTLASIPGTNAWKQYTKTITIPSNVNKVSIQHVLRRNGTLDLDAFSFGLRDKPLLTVAKAGTGTGTVTGTGINCGADCTENIVMGTAVTLTATPATGSAFAGWTGGCSGTGTCVVTVNAATTVTATFNPVPTFALTVAKDGTGTGTVTATGINCGTDCTETYNAGTVVALTATPTAGSTFAGWAGGCTGTAACSVTMNAVTTVTATFTLAPVATGLPTNGNFETPNPSNATLPLAWNPGSWGTLTAAFTYPTPGKTGNGGKVDVTSYTSGDAKWVFDPIASSGGKTYTFKYEYLSNAVSNISIEYHMTDGTFTYAWLGSPAASAAWTTFNGQFTVPIGADSFTVFSALTSVGSLTIDNVQIVDISTGNLVFPNGMVTLEFDDTLSSQYTVARPKLNAANMKASFYAITSATAGIGSDADYMTWANVTQLKTDGHEIGAHTRTHPDLTTLTTAQALDEINGSKTDLIAHGITPTTFVYPFGQFNAAIKQQVKDAGFIGARSVFDGFNFPSSDKYAMLDKHIESTTTLADVQGWLNQAKANKTWLIMEFHEQTTTPGADTGVYYNTPTMLQSIIDAITTTAIPVVTMHQGMQLMNP